jgi:hypothetical protein
MEGHLSDKSMVLSYEDILHYGSSADFQLRLARTPGLQRASTTERVIGFVLLAGASTLLYVHLDIRPFLPITLAAGTADLLLTLSFVGMGISAAIAAWFLISLGLRFADRLSLYLKMKSPSVTCTECGKANRLSYYVRGENCHHCGADTVYCGGCGMPVSFKRLAAGLACERCNAKSVSIKV